MLTSLEFLSPGQPWPPASEAERLREYDDHRKLFEGEHPALFNDWYKLLRHDDQVVLEFVVNLPKRLSTLWADMLWGESPRFTAGEDESDEQLTVDRLVRDNNLQATGHELVIDLSSMGDGLYKVRLEDGKAVIEGQPPEFWFPVVSPSNLRRETAHVLAWTFEGGSGREKQTYLRCEIHTPGRIEYRMHRLRDGKIGDPVDGRQFDPDWKDEEATKVDDFLIVPAPGLRTTRRYHGQSDYPDIISIVQEIEGRLGQIAAILNKHADPNLAGPESFIDRDEQGQPVHIGGSRYFAVAEGEAPPQYVVWDGQLTAAFDELKQLREWFYIVSDTSPAAFGQLEAGLAESGSALKRLMLAPLAHVNRLKLRLDPATRKAVQLAAALEAANGGEAVELPSVEIEWRDGIPDDPRESAEIEEIRLRSGNQDIADSIRALDGGSSKSIQEKVERIREGKAHDAGAQPAALPPRNLTLQFPNGQ